MRGRAAQQRRNQTLNNAKLSWGPRRADPERTHCYCGAIDLTDPHYQAEHTQEHDTAREIRAHHAQGPQ